MPEVRETYVKPKLTQLDYVADTQVALASCKFVGQAGLSGFACNQAPGPCADLTPS